MKALTDSGSEVDVRTAESAGYINISECYSIGLAARADFGLPLSRVGKYELLELSEAEI